jgi:NADPH-dependent glutamate synthase beta subunit-like oxidoreductase
MGVKIRTNTPLGPGLSIRDLFDQEFEAIYLAIGAHKPLPLGIKGEDAAGVVQGVAYLKSLNLGEPLPAGERTVVIGGGNVAVDVARSAVRSGAGEVTILYRRTRDEMPAYASEIEEALEEGVRISYLAAPEEIMVRDQKVAGVACVKMRLGEPDASGRRRPLPIEGTRYVIDADLVIPAIGQVPDVAPFDKMNGLAFEGRGNTIKVDHDTLATSIQGVFAGGDVVTGPATVIEAIASGKRAALAMDAFIRGVEMPKAPPVPRRRRNVATFEVSQEQLDRLKRPEIPLLSMDRRTSTFEQVELGLSNKTARDEAKRCLRCDLAS